MTAPTWGTVSTIKAPTDQILAFCAHHLSLGARQLHIYLDDDNRAAAAALAGHPHIHVTLCDDAYWQAHLGRRPVKHQARQVENARHAYARCAGLDWLTHIDVDELLWPATPLPAQLAALPPDCQVARLRPAEALATPAPGPAPITHFKRFTIDRATRDRQTRRAYPTFGMHLNGGFLSHVQGKLIYRTGQPGLSAKIHNVMVGDQTNPGQREMPGTELLHLHAHSWDQFRAAFQFRLERGSYRADLRPATQGGVTMHDLLTALYADTGEDGLRAFYTEVCTATPDLLARLRAESLMSSHVLDLDAKIAAWFPAA